MGMRVCIVGTGLIGASLGLALKSLDEMQDSEILGWDASLFELEKACEMGAIDSQLPSAEDVLRPGLADVYVLATPVLPIMDWMQRLAPVLGEAQLVTDVGSTKREIAALASTLYNGPGQAAFLPGHPMAGKESGGAALAQVDLFDRATWLFTPMPEARPDALSARWRALVEDLGARAVDIDAERHDDVCAYVSHLPQMLSTALAALLEDKFGGDPTDMAALQAIGGRALRETTRLGASPYSMWRDIALTNTAPLAEAVHMLEQRLAHMRENLRTPELRAEFSTANGFRAEQRQKENPATRASE